MYTNVCKHCKKIFRSKIKKGTCSECEALDGMYFDQIEVYLKKYPNSNALQISEALGISAWEVLRYVSEGRLNISKGKFSKISDSN